MNDKVNIIDSFKAVQNVDRIKFYNNSLCPKVTSLSAGYHLDPKTQIKKGGLFFFDSHLEEQKQYELITDYGILDLKYIKKDENILILTSNSDYSYSIFDIPNKVTHKHFIKDDEKKRDTCNNTLELVKGAEEKCIFGTNDGNIHIFDVSKGEELCSFNGHEYGIWSLFSYDDKVFYSGSEDATLKQWDIRVPGKATSICKSYNAGVNYINTLSFNSNVLITGSYQEKIYLFDARKFPEELSSKRINHSSWDIKQINYKNENLLFISSTYDGVNIWTIDSSLTLEQKHSYPLDKEEKKFHSTIVYGIDVRMEEDYIDVLTCSFYDNLILHWHYPNKN